MPHVILLHAAFAFMTKKERYAFVLDYFRKAIPDPETELQYTNPYELLVAVILSAQCTDKRVNLVTPSLFKKYPTVEDLATASPEEIFSLIRSISYPNNKAKHLAGMARKLVNEFGGEVPATIEELVTLPGVGRKTANVVLNIAFGHPTIAVDTHVFRVSNRTGLAKGDTVEVVEQKLKKVIPSEVKRHAHHWLILHGRYVCKARNPNCAECVIADLCPSHILQR